MIHTLFRKNKALPTRSLYFFGCTITYIEWFKFKIRLNGTHTHTVDISVRGDVNRVRMEERERKTEVRSNDKQTKKNESILENNDHQPCQHCHCSDYSSRPRRVKVFVGLVYENQNPIGRIEFEQQNTEETRRKLHESAQREYQWYLGIYWMYQRETCSHVGFGFFFLNGETAATTGGSEQRLVNQIELGWANARE